ncbi:MAG TPA: cytochrome P450 [Pseudonocardiaceae bacterium]|nr:cytochrome P450 [Pseudonocardiaceae bacterium]
MTDTSSIPGVFPTARPDGCPFDPATEYVDFRATDKLDKVSCPSGIDAYLLSGYDEVRTLLNDSRLSSRGAVSNHVIMDRDVTTDAAPGSIIHLDGQDHTRLRRLLTPEFTVKRMRALREYVADQIESHIDAMLAKGGPVDLVQEFALPIPSLVICELLGVPYEDREQFQSHSSILVSTDASPEQTMASSEAVQNYIAGMVMAKMQQPGEDLLSRLIQRGNEGEQPLSVPELITLGLSLLIAGHETTANMIGLSTLALLRNPEQLAVLREDASLAESAVEEMLRYLSIVQWGLLRYATEDIEYGEETIKAGDWLVAALASGNRDETVFPDAASIDVRRNPTAHLAFGFGAHQCIGQQLARVELQEVFSRLYRRIPTLRLAVPFEEIKFKDNALAYGVRTLPVTWEV